MNVDIRNYETGDWNAVRDIYRQGINTRNATFEESTPEQKEWEKVHFKICRLVAIIDGRVTGWATLLPVSSREAYSGVAEVSIYVQKEFSGKGIGRKLLERLIPESELHNIWTLQASIFPENRASIALHKSCGFREVGRREKIGKLNGVWRDTVLLERRSKIAGK